MRLSFLQQPSTSFLSSLLLFSRLSSSLLPPLTIPCFLHQLSEPHLPSQLRNMPPRTKNAGVKRKKISASEAQNPSNFLQYGYFTSSEHSKLYKNDYSLRKLGLTYALDLDWFRSQQGFDFINLLDDCKLLNFLTTKGSIATNLVKAFYTTLSYDATTDILTAELKGTKIHLTLAQFSNISHLPCDGEKVVYMGHNSIEVCRPDSWTEFKIDDAYASICHPSADVGKRPILANSLTTRIRLLHYAIARNILPKQSNFASVNYDELILLWGIKNGKSINWANLVVSHMLKCKNSQGKNLPYSVLITNILRHLNIPFLGEKTQKGNEAYHLFGETAINKMRFIQNGDTWHRATIGPASAAEYDPAEVEPMSPHSSPIPTAPAISSASLEQLIATLNVIQSEQRKMYEKNHQEILLSREIHSKELASLTNRLIALETRIDHIQASPSAIQNPDFAADHPARDSV